MMVDFLMPISHALNSFLVFFSVVRSKTFEEVGDKNYKFLNLLGNFPGKLWVV